MFISKPLTSVNASTSSPAHGASRNHARLSLGNRSAGDRPARYDNKSLGVEHFLPGKFADPYRPRGRLGHGVASGHATLGLTSTLVLVRLIQPADFGIIALATSFMQTIDGTLTLGTEEAIIREAAPNRGFYDTAFSLNLLRGLSVTVLIGAFAYPAAKFFDDSRLGPVLLFVACLPALDGVANIGVVNFRRDFAFHKEFAIMVLPKLCGMLRRSLQRPAICCILTSRCWSAWASIGPFASL